MIDITNEQAFCLPHFVQEMVEGNKGQEIVMTAKQKEWYDHVGKPVKGVKITIK